MEQTALGAMDSPPLEALKQLDGHPSGLLQGWISCFSRELGPICGDPFLLYSSIILLLLASDLIGILLRFLMLVSVFIVMLMFWFTVQNCMFCLFTVFCEVQTLQLSPRKLELCFFSLFPQPQSILLILIGQRLKLGFRVRGVQEQALCWGSTI